MKYRYPAFFPAAYDRVITHLIFWWSRIKSKLMCWAWGVRTGRNVVFVGPTILRSHGGDIEIGNNTRFNSVPELNTVGLQNQTILDTRFGGRVSIGNNCGFSSVVMSSKIGITIGDRVLVGGNTRLFDHDYHSMDAGLRSTQEDTKNAKSAPVVIDDDVFIGTNVIVLKGTHIGARSIVSAGSVVFGLDIPPDSLVKGNPASVVRSIANH